VAILETLLIILIFFIGLLLLCAVAIYTALKAHADRLLEMKRNFDKGVEAVENRLNRK
jgi:sensor domain CHASE-containing protein